MEQQEEGDPWCLRKVGSNPCIGVTTGAEKAHSTPLYFCLFSSPYIPIPYLPLSIKSPIFTTNPHPQPSEVDSHGSYDSFSLGNNHPLLPFRGFFVLVLSNLTDFAAVDCRQIPLIDNFDPLMGVR